MPRNVTQKLIESHRGEGRIADGDKVHVGALEGGLTNNGATVAMA